MDELLWVYINDHLEELTESSDVKNSDYCLALNHMKGVQRYTFFFKRNLYRVSLVAQWLGIHLPMQGTRVGALVQEDPTGCGATKPMHHNY